MAIHNNRQEADAALISAASSFSATVFLGRAQYDTVRDLPSLEDARAAAKALLVKHPTKHAAMVYAISGNSSAHVENVTR